MTRPTLPDELALLEAMKRSWDEQFRFFSNSGKDERERWVVAEFLNCLGVQFSDVELQSQHPASKVDVQFRDASFQIKEITNPNVRRGDEIKTTYQRVMAAKTLQDTVGPGLAVDIPSVTSGYELVKARAMDLAVSEVYRDHKTNLDLMFYVTRPRTSLISEEQRRLEELAESGWRSVSCLIGRQATVLFATKEAPIFLREAVKR